MEPPSLPDLPDAYVRRMAPVFGSREALTDALAQTPATTIRPNPTKTPLPELRARLEALGIRAAPVPFSDEGWVVEDPLTRPLGSLWEHQAGHFMVQDAASLLPVMALDPRPGERILDLCAAPGGKTTHIAQRMNGEGLLVANEPRLGRLSMLGTNLDRMGGLNVAVTRGDGRHRRWPLFDKVLVDAPCSNLGGHRDSLRRARRYDENVSRGLARLQRDLLTAAYHATRAGGTIVYSTCTLEPHENEAVAHWFLTHHDVEASAFRPPVGQPGLTELLGDAFHGDVAATRRIHPGDGGTGGFFVARFTKTGAASARTPEARPSRFTAVAAGPVDEVRATYGLAAGPPEGAHATRTRRRLYVSNVPDVDEALALGAERVGVYLATDEGDGWRLGFDAATTWGREARRRVDLDPATARMWLAGHDVETTRGTPWSVVTCGSEPIGASRAYGRLLQSFVPKARRVPDEPPARHGFLARRPD